MQVAGVVSAQDVARLPNKSQRAALIAEMGRVEINFTHIEVHSQFTVREVKEPSPLGLAVLSYIASSTRLSKDQKKTLARLVAIVDEFAGGDPKLMRDIIGIAKIMEAGATRSYKPTPFMRMLKEYMEWRERIDPSESVTIDVRAEINAVSIQYIGVTAEVALAPKEA